MSKWRHRPELCLQDLLLLLLQHPDLRLQCARLMRRRRYFFALALIFDAEERSVGDLIGRDLQMVDSASHVFE